MRYYFHPTITSKLWRTQSATGNHWVCCFTSWVFFLISWIQRHRTIVLCNENTENTLQHPGHMHSHVPTNAETNIVRREGRINALQSYTLKNLAFWLKNVMQTFWSWSKTSQTSIIYIEESCIQTKECNADFLKLVKNQPDTYIYWMEMRNITNFSLFLMRRCIDLLSSCQKPTIKGCRKPSSYVQGQMLDV